MKKKVFILISFLIAVYFIMAGAVYASPADSFMPEKDSQVTAKVIDTQNNVLEERQLIKEYYQEDISGGYSFIQEYRVKWIDNDTKEVLQDFTDAVVTQLTTDLTNKRIGIADEVKVYPKTPEMDKKMEEAKQVYQERYNFLEQHPWIYDITSKFDIVLVSIIGLLAIVILIIIFLFRHRIKIFTASKHGIKGLIIGLVSISIFLSGGIAKADYPPSGWSAKDYIWGYNQYRQRYTRQSLQLPYTLSSVVSKYPDGSKVGPSRATPIIIGDNLYGVDTASGKFFSYNLIERNFNWVRYVNARVAVNADYYYAQNILVLPISTALSSSSSNTVALIDATNGSIIKTFSLATGLWTASEPIVLDNYAVVTTRTGYIYRINIPLRSLDKTAQAVDSGEMFVGSPTRVWSGAYTDFVLASDKGAGTVGGHGNLYRYDVTLTRKYVRQGVVTYGAQATPISDGEYIYVLNDVGGMQKFNLSGTQLGAVPSPGSGWRAINSPAWVNGYLYYHVENADGKSYAYKVRTSDMAQITWNPSGEGSHAITGSMSATNSTLGEVIWWPYRQENGSAYLRGVSASNASPLAAFKDSAGGVYSYWKFNTDDFSSIVVGGGSKYIMAAIGSTGLGIWESAYPDLRPTALTLPSNPNTTTAYTYKATIQNNGAWAAGAFKVALQVDGSTVSTIDVSGLAKGASTTVSFNNIKISTPGNHTIKVVVDSSGQVTEQLEDNNTISRTLNVVDVAPPSISISPMSRDWGNTDIAAAVSVSDIGGSGVNSVQYAWTTSATKPSGGWINTSASSTLTQSGNGTWYLHVQATDNAGNYAYTYAGSYRIDKAIPDISASPISRDWDNSDVTVTLTYTDSGGSGVATKQYAWSTSTTTPSTWSTYSGPVTQSNTGTWYLHARAVDNAGNVKTEYFSPYRIDKVAPTISASPANRIWDNTDVSVTLTYADAGGAGLSTRQYAWSTSNSTQPTTWTNYTAPVTQSADGVWYLWAKAVDGVGNTTIKCFGAYQIDKTAPTITASPANRVWDNTDVSVTLAYADASGAGLSTKQYAWSTSNSVQPSTWTNYTVPVVQIAEGNWYLWAKAVDSAGNTIIKCFGPYQIDKTIPSAIFSPNSCSWDNSIIVTVTPTDTGGSGINNWRYAISKDGGTNYGTWSSYYTDDATVTLSTSAIYKLKVEVSDKAGNVSTVYSGSYNIDNAAPTVTAVPASRDWGNTDVSVTLTYADAGGSGLATKQYAWSTSTTAPTTWSNYTAAVTQATQGTWYLHAKATDIAGNVTTQYFGPYKIDKTVPTITASLASRDWGNTDVSITLTYADAGGSGLATKQYAWSTSTTAPTTWSNYTAAVTQATQGTWYLHVKATDIAGNVKTQYFGPYKIDKTVPTITASPASRDWEEAPVTIALNYTDSGGSGIVTKQYAWSTSTTTPTAWTDYTAAITQAAEGTWYLHAKATDAAGNVKTQYFGPYKVDKLLYITISPSETTIVRTETLPLIVRATYYSGITKDVTAGSLYTSDNTSVAEVDSYGVVTGKNVGTAAITAVYNGKQAQASITVQEPEKTVSGNITITTAPTYIYTKWHKDANGDPAQAQITVTWDNLNLLFLRADKTVLRSEPITVTKAESQHRIDRYTVIPSYSWGILKNQTLTGISGGKGVYRAYYEYDKAGKPTSPFTFTGTYLSEGTEKSFDVTVEIPVNGISTTLRRSNVPLPAGFAYPFTNAPGKNKWEYRGVWPASGVLTIGGAAGEMQWPVPGNTVISSYYGRRIDPITGVVTTHHGIDIPAPEGTNIISPEDGTVVFAGWNDSYGNLLVIRSGGHDYMFGHCGSFLVAKDQTVSKGQAIAKVGTTGRSTGPHLDLRITVGPYTQGNYIDPLTIVKP
jgi:murein DD-endopeptidase MepM/ murein hydrolase activator NlpD